MTPWMLAGAAFGYLIAGWTGAAVGVLVGGAVALFWPYALLALGVVIWFALAIAAVVALFVIMSGKSVDRVLSQLGTVGVALLWIGLPFGLGALVTDRLESEKHRRFVARAIAGAIGGTSWGLLAVILGAVGVLPGSDRPIWFTGVELMKVLMTGIALGLIVGTLWTVVDTGVPHAARWLARGAGRTVRRVMPRRREE